MWGTIEAVWRTSADHCKRRMLLPGHMEKFACDFNPCAEQGRSQGCDGDTEENPWKYPVDDQYGDDQW